MTRVFADLHLRANNKVPGHVLTLTRKAAELGYKFVAIPLSPEATPEEVKMLRSTCSEAGLDSVSRVDLRPRNQNELLSLLRRLRRRFEIVCVLCESKDIARQAAKDHRVDLLNFPLLDYRRRFFDHAEAELASTGSAAYEVDLKPLLVLEGPARIRLLSSLRREVAIALEFRLPIIISSGVSESLLLRMPRETMFLGSLFGLESTVALDAVSSIPAGIVQKNREKLTAGFVAPGIRIIKEGDDC